MTRGKAGLASSDEIFVAEVLRNFAVHRGIDSKHGVIVILLGDSHQSLQYFGPDEHDVDDLERAVINMGKALQELRAREGH